MFYREGNCLKEKIDDVVLIYDTYYENSKEYIAIYPKDMLHFVVRRVYHDKNRLGYFKYKKTWYGECGVNAERCRK